jgi:uncharacterized membrane protein YphA (DoxX/SURF4 family)
MEDAANLSCHEKLVQLRSEAKISEAEYKELLTAIQVRKKKRGKQPIPAERWLRKTIVLTLLAVGLCFVSAVKAMQNEIRRARFRERDFKQKAAYALGKEVRERVSMAIKAGMTKDRFEEVFGEVTPIEGTDTSKKSRATHSYCHPASQRRFKLRFDDGVLMGFSGGHSSGSIDTGVVLESAQYRAGESVRRWVLLLCLSGWVVTLVLCVVCGFWRRSLSSVLVGFAVLCLVGWYLAPNYSPTIKGMGSNDLLAWGGLLVGVSLIWGYVFYRYSPVKSSC